MRKIYKSRWFYSKEWVPEYIKPYGNFVLFIPVIFIGLLYIAGLVTLGLIISDAMGALEARLNEKDWWMQMLMCMGIIVFYFGIRIHLDELKKKSKP